MLVLCGQGLLVACTAYTWGRGKPTFRVEWQDKRERRQSQDHRDRGLSAAIERKDGMAGTHTVTLTTNKDNIDIQGCIQ
jgi:hypothetical protein